MRGDVPDYVRELTGSDFDAIWDAMAERGGCDMRGGAEYTRVRATHEAMVEEPEHLAEFIWRQANAPPYRVH